MIEKPKAPRRMFGESIQLELPGITHYFQIIINIVFTRTDYDLNTSLVTPKFKQVILFYLSHKKLQRERGQWAVYFTGPQSFIIIKFSYSLA